MIREGVPIMALALWRREVRPVHRHRSRPRSRCDNTNGADYAEAAEFEQSLGMLIRLAGSHFTAIIMCAEAVPEVGRLSCSPNTGQLYPL